MPLIKGFSVVGVRAGEYGRQFPERGRENIEQIWRWAKDGKTRPYIHDTLSLDQTVDGFRHLRDRKVVGKLIVEP
jgi:NADPH2:quinone reductase